MVSWGPSVFFQDAVLHSGSQLSCRWLPAATLQIQKRLRGSDCPWNKSRDCRCQMTMQIFQSHLRHISKQASSFTRGHHLLDGPRMKLSVGCDLHHVALTTVEPSACRLTRVESLEQKEYSSARLQHQRLPLSRFQQAHLTCIDTFFQG